MDKEILIAKTRALSDREDLFNLINEIKSDLLGDTAYPIPHKQFLYLCNPKKAGRYNYFEIPKKSGDTRQISAPSGNLKWIQLCLNEIFKALYTPSPYAMGFTVGRSIVDNALMHTNQNYVFNIDLEDFFPSIDQARVWKRLQLPPFNFNAKIASVIAGFCSIKSLRCSKDATFSECFVLPQGAPTSPLLTNAICDNLDRRLNGLAKRFGLHYSRYADDITFSSMHNVYQPGSEFRKELNRIIIDQRFTINEKKTRLNHRSSRQEVTGLTVGEKINVSRKYVKDLRAILHIWEKYGHNAAFATFYPRYKSEKGHLHHGEPNLENVISGKLCYLKMVKGENDPVYIKLHEQFLRITKCIANTIQNSNIEYLLTLPKADFEKKLGTAIKFSIRKSDHKPYGLFSFQGRNFIVAVSKNLDINKLPDNVQISLTRMVRSNDTQIGTNESMTSSESPEISIAYLLHKPLLNYIPKDNFKQDSDNISVELKDFIINLASTHPKLGLKDNMGILESSNPENLLARLVDSNFDLSILP
ncbi:MAG: reverse transcriptase family protein [Muribaculaceae bacterium]|nr:reverse transcriptase family protein [Muribaculaceae bacterium]